MSKQSSREREGEREKVPSRVRVRDKLHASSGGCIRMASKMLAA